MAAVFKSDSLESLQGKWTIVPDGAHEYVVQATVTGTNVHFSDYPKSEYQFRKIGECWAVNGWKIELVLQGVYAMILSKPKEAPAVWTRPLEWRELQRDEHSSIMGELADQVPQTADFLQGEWEIDPDEAHAQPVIATITNNIVKFSNYPRHNYTLTQTNGTFSVNGWSATQISKDLLTVIFTKPGEVRARWVRSTNWVEANLPAQRGYCPLCFDDADGGISCPDGHFICRDHLRSYVETSTRTLDELEPQVFSGLLRCTQPDCLRAYSLPQCGRLLLGTQRKSLLEGLHAIKVRNEVRELLDTTRFAGFDTEGVRSYFRRTDAAGNVTYAAYMCPVQTCRFGPVDHGHCANLASHHNQKVGQNSAISNACPKCGFFTERLADWHKWDGTFRN